MPGFPESRAYADSKYIGHNPVNFDKSNFDASLGSDLSANNLPSVPNHLSRG